MQISGFWAVEVARNGIYEFALRRWPVEVDAPATSWLKLEAEKLDAKYVKAAVLTH